MSLRSFISQRVNGTPFNWIAGRISRLGSRAENREFREARRILVIKSDEIGDVVLSLGFLRAIRQANPEARITVAVRAMAVPLIPVPAVADEVLVWDERWRSWPVSFLTWRHLAGFARQRFRAAPPDWVLIPRGGGDHMHMALFAWWTGARRICAHLVLCTAWGPDRRPLVSDVISGPNDVHEIQLHNRMLAHLGVAGTAEPVALELPAGAFDSWPVPLPVTTAPGRLVALGIGAGSYSRRWPGESFAALLPRLLSTGRDLGVVIVGGRDDQAEGDSLAALAPDRVVNFAGKLTLIQSAALLQRCTLYIGNDSGPMHLAAAAGCAVVEISKHPLGGDDASPSSPVRFAPLAARRRICQPLPQSPECSRECNHNGAHCIAAVSVADVYAAALALLSPGPA